MKEEFCSGGIVYKKTKEGIKILFILDPYNKWAFPKGHIEDKETKIGAAAREVSEETNIKIKDLRIKKHLGDINYKFKSIESEEIDKTVYFYLIKLLNNKTEVNPQAEDGIKDIKWVDIDEAMEFCNYDNSMEILRKAVEILKNKK